MFSLSTCGLLDVHSTLLSHFGDPGWWPGETPFEIAVGAILTQNISWSNVEISIRRLKKEGMLDAHRISSTRPEDLSMMIRSTGYHRIKASYLRSFSVFLLERYGGDMGAMATVGTGQIRNELLGVKGIGEETADSILCYSLSRPMLVIDAYTRRLIRRLSMKGYPFGPGGAEPSYSELQGIMMALLKGDDMMYNRFHALVVMLCKKHCLTGPSCSGCPLVRCCATGKKRI